MLTTIALDLQIAICTFLHPSDILALRQTCKILEDVTRERIVWIDALRRVCFHNYLFLPSFLVSDMSDMELEQAAMAPHRWIKLCSEFAKQYSGDPDAMLRPRTRRIIEDPLVKDWSSSTFLVPGGRYLVVNSSTGICVWDLGYTSNTDCKLLASVGLQGESSSFLVNTTSDGMGLVIAAFRRIRGCSVYEIYPQCETPQLTLVAHLDFAETSPTFLLSNKVICCRNYDDRFVFTVWDYRLNHSISFSARLKAEEFYRPKIIATTTMIIMLYREEILVWVIPQLSSQPPDFYDPNPTHVPPSFTISLPDDLIHKMEISQWLILPDWYSVSSHSICFGLLSNDLKLYDLQLIIKPDLSDISLHVIDTCVIDTRQLIAEGYTPYPRNICEDTHLSCELLERRNRCTLYIRSTSSCHPNIIPPECPIVLQLSLPDTSLFYVESCAASGRFVHSSMCDPRRIVVADFLTWF